MTKKLSEMNDDELVAELRKAMKGADAIEPRKTLADIRKAIEDAQKDTGNDVPKPDGK